MRALIDKLNPNPRKAADLLLAAHPSVVFTSGRRDAKGQCYAMASNAIRYGSAWLAQTYKDQRAVKLLMTFMAENPEHCRCAEDLGHCFYRELDEHLPAFLTRTPHVRGDAFDLACPRQPDGSIDEARVAEICATIRRVSEEHQLGLELLLTREGFHRVIHAQFLPSAEV